MNTNQDEKWQSLLSLSAPTFAGENTPPYGFLTRTMALLHAEKREREMTERIGLRAIFASLTALVASVALTLTMHGWMDSSPDLDPGVKTIIQVENVPIS